MKHTHVMSATVAAVLALALISAPQSASAATGTASIAVSTTVANTCTFTNGTLTFGAYTGVVDNATGTFTVNCTNNADYSIALNKGAGTGATITTRQMMNGTYSLGYTINTTAGGGTIWGDGTTGSTVSGVGTGSAQTISVFGVIPAGETAISGSYTDTITATVTY